MYYSIVSPRKTSILLLFIPSIILNVSSFPFFRRSNPGCGNIDDEAVFSDGPTSDKTAGMGVEFETLSLLFLPTGCTQDQINQLKGKMIDGRQGTNWKFTGDTTFENALSAEYILDGTQIKINTNAAGSVAAAVAADLVRESIGLLKARLSNKPT
jgi:hypothetical protein